MGRATPLGRKGSLLHRKKKWRFASIRRRTYTWLIHALAEPRAAFKFQIVRRIHLSWSVYDKVPLSHRTRRVVRSASPRLASPRVPLKIEETGVSEKGENSKGDFWEAVDGRRSIALDRRFPPPFPNLSTIERIVGGSSWPVGRRDAPSRASRIYPAIVLFSSNP